MRNLEAVLAVHFKTHRGIEPQDVYKLIYQRVLGPEHAMENRRAAMEALYVEVLRLPPAPAVMTPLIEPLSPALCRCQFTAVRAPPWQCEDALAAVSPHGADL